MQRALILALLCEGQTTILTPTWGTEITCLFDALIAFGLRVLTNSIEELVLVGVGRRLRLPDKVLYSAGSAFMVRTVAVLACLCNGRTLIVADKTMVGRPIVTSIDFIVGLGAKIEQWVTKDELYIEVTGPQQFGGPVTVSTNITSQALSAILMVAPLADIGISITTAGSTIVSEGYVELTLQMMAARGRPTIVSGSVLSPSLGRYAPSTSIIPSDFTALSYIAGAVLAVSSAEVLVRNYRHSHMTSETTFFSASASLGVIYSPRGELAHSPSSDLHLSKGCPFSPSTIIDGHNIPSVIPVLMASAPFVGGQVTISNVGHVNHHKSPRVMFMLEQLSRIGCIIAPIMNDQGMAIGCVSQGPQQPHGGVHLASGGDHRVTAALSIASLGCLHPNVVDGFENMGAGFGAFHDLITELTVIL